VGAGVSAPPGGGFLRPRDGGAALPCPNGLSDRLKPPLVAANTKRTRWPQSVRPVVACCPLRDRRAPQPLRPPRPSHSRVDSRRDGRESHALCSFLADRSSVRSLEGMSHLAGRKVRRDRRSQLCAALLSAQGREAADIRMMSSAHVKRDSASRVSRAAHTIAGSDLALGLSSGRGWSRSSSGPGHQAPPTSQFQPWPDLLMASSCTSSRSPPLRFQRRVVSAMAAATATT